MRLSLLIAGLLIAVPAHAIDKQGRFAIDGAGAAPCSLFLDARAKRDQRYFMFGGWIDGYTSAMNVYEPKTFDVTPWQSTDLIAAAVAEQCRRTPKFTMHEALVEVSGSLRRGRLETRSPLVVAGPNVPGAPVIYQATLKQAQARLKVAQTGKLDTATRSALTDFQKRNKLPATGLPDQATLYSLLGRSAG